MSSFATASRKRERDSDVTSVDDAVSPTEPLPTSGGASTTNFRNVSACDRCRNRKNRCDQKLPKCSNCEKAKQDCVGFDPVSKRKIPRSYVYYLETRVQCLEALLEDNKIFYPPPEKNFSISDSVKPGENVPYPIINEDGSPVHETKPIPLAARATLDPLLREHDEGQRLSRLVNSIGTVSVKGTTDPRFQPSASGITFNRIVHAAMKSSAHHSATPPERSGSKTSKQLSGEAAGGSAAMRDSSAMRDSFYGLYTKPTITPAPFPEKELGEKLSRLYFEHANPQIPVLHRYEFKALLNRVYDTDPKKRTPRELYMLNIVFAIGSGIIMDSSNVDHTMAAADSPSDTSEAPSKKRLRLASQQYQPEEYHASAIVHLESFLDCSPSTEGVSGGLEELQAVLLLAGLALLRPVAPGLWYIIGVAVRLSIDLGLHFEDIDPELDTNVSNQISDERRQADFGRKQWTRDLRRRLWWCVFNLDRLVSSCVGRPISISESVVTTEFPSMLDDKFITTSGFLQPPNSELGPSYKVVSRHYLRLRLLQSEIMQVLQHRQANKARSMGANRTNPYLHDLPSSFLSRFASFREWRIDIDNRLYDWKESAPRQIESGVAFNPLFLDLNYWQAIIMLYKQSLSVPEPLASELSAETGEEVRSPGALHTEHDEDKQMVFLKVAQAGFMVLKTYRSLHRDKLVSYTFLATHHLFMSGISFLYAIWHSSFVRRQLTVEDADFTILAATSVLGDLAERCPPAEACKSAFERMSRATISMVMGTTGFGQASTLGNQPLHSSGGYFAHVGKTPPDHNSLAQTHARRKVPIFDYNLRSLFSDEEIASRIPTPHARSPDLVGQTMTKAPEFSHRLRPSTSPQISGPRIAGAYQQMQQHADAGIPNNGASYQSNSPQQAYQSLAETISQQQPPPPPQSGYTAFDNLESMGFASNFSGADLDSEFWGGGHASAGGFDLDVVAGGFDGTWGEDLPLEHFFFGDSGNGFA